MIPWVGMWYYFTNSWCTGAADPVEQLKSAMHQLKEPKTVSHLRKICMLERRYHDVLTVCKLLQHLSDGLFKVLKHTDKHVNGQYDIDHLKPALHNWPDTAILEVAPQIPSSLQSLHSPLPPSPPATSVSPDSSRVACSSSHYLFILSFFNNKSFVSSTVSNTMSWNRVVATL